MLFRLKTVVLVLTCPLPSRLRVVIYRLLGFSVGKRSKLCPLSVVVAPDISIGEYTKIWPLAIVTSGSALRIGSYCQVTPFAFIYGDRELALKDRCYVGPRAVINMAEKVVVGPNSGIGPNSTLYSHGVFLPYSKGFPRRFGPIEIGENVWLGVGVCVLPGVKIGANSIIGSGVVVPKSIPSNSYVQSHASKFRVTNVEMIKHDKHSKPEILVEDILSGLVRHCQEFSYEKLCGGEYQLRLNSVAAGLKLIDGEDGGTKRGEKARSPSILFLFNAPSLPAQVGSRAAWFDIDELTVSESKDPMVHFLRRNLEKYFGMNFRYVASQGSAQSRY